MSKNKKKSKLNDVKTSRPIWIFAFQLLEKIWFYCVRKNMNFILTYKTHSKKKKKNKT